MMYRILIIEDDIKIAGAVRDIAVSWGFEARAAENFRDILSEFASYQPHIILLDIGLPFYNGYHWCAELRKITKAPIIFISSASDNMNIVMAMNMGADDFIAKPFDTDVLIAKIQALLRRTYDFAGSMNVIEHRGAFLNTGDGTLTYEGEQIPLTKNEYKILQCLFENRGRVVSRERLMESLWKTREYVDENTLTVNINRLRKKLDAAGLCDLITTKVGSGYIVE